MNLKDHHTEQELQKLYCTEKDARLARRMHAIYLVARGLSCAQIMTITGATCRTIQQWVHKYNKQGIDGLKDKQHPGQPTKLPRRDEPRFCKRIETGPTKKDGVSVLNGPAIRRILECEFGVLYSQQGFRYRQDFMFTTLVHEAPLYISLDFAADVLRTVTDQQPGVSLCGEEKMLLHTQHLSRPAVSEVDVCIVANFKIVACFDGGRKSEIHQ